MPAIEELVPLRNFNTFGIDVTADYFVKLHSAENVKNFLKNKDYKKIPMLILGGGSNLLFTSNSRGIVVKPDIQGIEITLDETSHCYVRCGAGVDWDNFVGW